MRFRTGVIVGFAVGYYYGARAGHARYEQIAAVLDRVRTSPPYRRVADALQESTGEVRDRARQSLEELLPDHLGAPQHGTPHAGDDPVGRLLERIVGTDGTVHSPSR